MAQPVDLLRLQHGARADKRLLAVSVDDLRKYFFSPLPAELQRDFQPRRNGVVTALKREQRLRLGVNTAQDSG
ncbi:hypothetical protein LAD77_00780 [Klebsiella pneumoniae]|nr:hypothetical protein [Klebsiella pneumoniae]